MSRVVVAGGGIGGLATALRLADRGQHVVLLERNDEFSELGAGIQLAPNGVHALDRLGLGDRVRRAGVHIDELRFMDGLTGEHVVSMPLTDDYRRRFDNPYVVVHRGELHEMLLDRARRSSSIELRAGCAVAGYEQVASGASAILASGERVTGDALIGADGLHSRIRAQLVGDGDPRVSGITVYRALIPMSDVPPELRWNAVTWWAGPGCHFVHYPIAGGKYLNLAASSADGVTDAFAGVPVDRDTARAEFAVLGDVPQRLLELGDGWRTWVLVDRDPVPDWTDGRVTLLGDAAHPMLHYAAQGACQAMEDAVALGDLFDDGAVPEALAAYNTTRRERTARVQRVSRDSIALWHASGDRARTRNAALSTMSAGDLHDHVAWMHGERTEVPA